MFVSKLVLYPHPPEFVLREPESVRRTLRDLGLLGEPYTFRGAPVYLAGPEFMELIMFLGCAPVMREQPPADSDSAANFYYLELPPADGRVRFLGSAATRAPRCPLCGGMVEDWREALAAWRAASGPFTHTCGKCRGDVRLEDLKWRNFAAFATTSIAICGVFESEAVPSPALLKALAEAGGTPWKYFYRLPGPD